MMLELSPDTIARYRETAKKRRVQEREEIALRRQQAWVVAKIAAKLLKEKFKAERVVAFGSLAREVDFTRWSDVDIAAWGIAPEDTFRAIGAVMDLGSELVINLVDINTCRPSLIANIERDGVEL